MRKGDTLDLTIEKMAFGGKGIARVEGFVVFVRGAVPGDRVLARLFKKKKDYGEALLVELLDPSTDREEPPCPYSGHCGGCQWQQVRYETQLHYKRDHVSECMVHIGGLKGIPVREVQPSDRVFGYRNKMEFSFSDRRWLLPEQMKEGMTPEGFALGLHAPGTFSRVIDIERCLLQREGGNEILRAVRSAVKESGLPVYGLKTHEGFWRYLTIRYSTAFNQWMVNVVTAEEKTDRLLALAETLAGQTGVSTVVNNINSRKAGVAVGDQEVVILGEGNIRDMIGPFTFRISANSFFQTNSPTAGCLYEQVVQFAELKGDEEVLDLYSGTGTIPIFLARRAGRVTGIELVPSAISDASRNCRENGIDNCEFICGDVLDALAEVRHKPDVLIVDPPRAGMHPDVLSRVLTLLPEKVVYVSCNPSTMARDLGRMIQHYDVTELCPFDMFPHTYHVETAANLRLRKR